VLPQAAQAVLPRAVRAALQPAAQVARRLQVVLALRRAAELRAASRS
jgi:septum formation topological specificity factor MinE